MRELLTGPNLARLICLLILILLPLVIPSPYIRHLLIIAFIYAIVASNWGSESGICRRVQLRPHRLLCGRRLWLGDHVEDDRHHALANDSPCGGGRRHRCADRLPAGAAAEGHLRRAGHLRLQPTLLSACPEPGGDHWRFHGHAAAAAAQDRGLQFRPRRQVRLLLRRTVPACPLHHLPPPSGPFALRHEHHRSA